MFVVQLPSLARLNYNNIHHTLGLAEVSSGAEEASPGWCSRRRRLPHSFYCQAT